MNILFIFQLKHDFTGKFIMASTTETSSIDKNKMMVSTMVLLIQCHDAISTDVTAIFLVLYESKTSIYVYKTHKGFIEFVIIQSWH